MGFFSSIRKEALINRLGLSFQKAYGCTAWTACLCLRKNYTADELGEILAQLKSHQAQGTLDFGTQFAFKETRSEVEAVNGGPLQPPSLPKCPF